MEIITKTKDLGILEFSCTDCETKFKAVPGEYRQRKGERWLDLPKTGPLFLRVYPARVIPSWVCTIQCPQCGREVVNEDTPTGDPERIDNRASVGLGG